MTRWSATIGVALATDISFDEASNSIWFVAADGRLGSLRVLGQRVRWHGNGWSDVIAAAPHVDGLSVAVIRRSGTVEVVSRDNADAAYASVVITVGSALVAAVRLSDGRFAVLTASGDLALVDIGAGTANLLVGGVLEEGVTEAGAMAVDAAGIAVVVIRGETSSLIRIDLATGDLVGTAVALDRPTVAMTVHPGGGGVIVADDLGALRPVMWSGVDGHTETVDGATALAHWHSLLFVATGDRVELVEWGDDIAILPTEASPDPLTPGGWVPMLVDYAAAGVDPGTITWLVAEGPEAGTVSVGSPRDADRYRYEHRVLAGSGPTEFTVFALDAGSGEVMASRRFRCVAVWPDDEIGPPLAITGAHRVYAKWGGGSAGPENIRSHPAPEEIKMAVVVFRTKGATSSANGDDLVKRFRDYVMAPGESVRSYYEEVSGRSTPASLVPADPKGSTVKLLGERVFGPIDLPWAWGELFAPGSRTNRWSSWNPKDRTWDTFGGTFASHLLDLGLAEQFARNADSVLFAVLPGTDDPYKVGTEEWPAQWSWAMASTAQMYFKTEFSTSFIRRPAIVMPAAFPANIPADLGPWSHKEWVSTIAHELAHNLGCPDLYNAGAFPAEVDPRLMGAWDLMHIDAALSHFSLAHRMRLGWVNPAWVEVFDFAANPAGRAVTLQASETIPRRGPAAGRKAGIEIRIRPGWNYYFEYRRRQAGQIGDQTLPVAQAVLGTDVNLPKEEEMDRPLILQLPVDVDGDGPVLRSAGADYEESDVTNEDRMNDFRLTRQPSGILGGELNAVNVQVEYLGAHRAELQIRPAPGRGVFKSPDIDVDGPGGPNVVVKGKTNRLLIRVRNAGTKGADHVNIRVQWLPFTTSAGPWNSLPSPPRQSIPSRQTRQFIVDWPVPVSLKVGDVEVEHFCVRVDVDRYVDPLDPAGDEIVVHNNWAQSNFNTAAAGHGSPSSRQSTAVVAYNKLPVTATHRTILEQTGDQFRAYIGAAWQVLGPGVSGFTTLDYESLAGDPTFGPQFERAFRQADGEELATDLAARGFLHAPPHLDGPIERFGAQLFVRAGQRTFVRSAEVQGEGVVGEVSAGWPEDPQPVFGGTVRVTGWLVDRPEEQFWHDSPLHNDGTFAAMFPEELFALLQLGRARCAVHYLGTPRFTPCHSEDLDIP